MAKYQQAQRMAGTIVQHQHETIPQFLSLALDIVTKKVGDDVPIGCVPDDPYSCDTILDSLVTVPLGSYKQ